MLGAVATTVIINQIVNGVVVGITLYGAVAYKKIPTIKIK